MERTITVKGRADISVSPDYTTVTFFLKESNKDYKKALENLKQKSFEVSECSKSVGLNEENIKTTNYWAEPLKKTERDRRGNYFQVDDGYECSQTLSVGFETDPVLLGELINVINGKIDNPDMSIDFSIKDKKKFEDELIKKVTEDALNKAKIFCQPSNATIGRLISVDFQRGNIWLPFPNKTFSSSVSQVGQTAQLSQPNPAARMPVMSNAPTPPIPQPPILNNIIPQERKIEEEAVFVWEIIDIEKE